MRLNQDNLQQALLRPATELLHESNSSALVIDLASISSFPPSELQAIYQWARGQVCPIIGLDVANASENETIKNSVDVVIENEIELSIALENVKHHPTAATIFVQLLRIIEKLPIQDALIAESFAYATLQSGREFARWLDNHKTQSPAPLLQETGPPLLIERLGDNVNLTLNRPQSSNAYTVEMRDALTEAFQWIQLDSSISRVNVSAVGPCFGIGGELSEFGRVSDPATAHLIRSQVLPASYLIPAAERYHFHVHRACIGSSLELAAFAGRVTADPKTFFSLPELKMGLMPGAGGCVSVSRRIGRWRTAYLVLMSKKINAQKAFQWGLVDEIVSY